MKTHTPEESKRAKLEAEARALATKLGHTLGAFFDRGSGEHLAYCVGCLDEVVLAPRIFGKATMRGPAIAFHCKKPKPPGKSCRHCGTPDWGWSHAPLCKHPDRMGACEL